jgi:MFS superfamily sulfate permease-like transporter
VAAKIYAKKYNYSISPNRELVAMGMANLIGSFFHSFPTFGSLTRSAMADSLGNKTQIFSFVSATMALFTILFLNKLVYYLPRVVMSSLILVAACSLFEFEDLLFLLRIRAWMDIFLLLATFFITLTLGLDLGILISVCVSILMVLKHTTFPHIAILGKNQAGEFVDVRYDKEALVIPGVVIVRIDERLYFANIEQIKDMFKRIEQFGKHTAHPTDTKEETPVKAIVVNARNISKMDASAIHTFYEMMQEYHKNNIFVCFAKLHPNLKVPFLNSGIIDSVGGNRVFPSVSDAIKYINKEVLQIQQYGPDK